MEFSEIKRILSEEAAALGVAEYDIFFSKAESLSAETLQDEISSFSSSNGIGVCFRCIRDGKFGYASGERLEESELRGLVSKAYDNAMYVESDDEAEIFRGSEKYETVEDVSLPEISTAELKKIALDIQKATYAADNAVTDGTQSGVGVVRSSRYMYNSYGLELHSSKSAYQYLAAAVVNCDGESEEDYDYRYATNFDGAEQMARDVVKQALSKIGAGSVSSGTYNVVFSGKMMATLLGTFSGIFSAKNAQLGLSRLEGKEGSVVASPNITITDDPFSDMVLCKTAFDAEGVATATKNVVENGQLKTLLYDLATAKKAGKTTTANASRGSYASPTSISPYCFYINGGEHSFDDILAMAGDGIYITDLKGLHAGANAVTGDFSIESAGFLIHDGKLAGAVKSFTVADNFYDLIGRIDALSDHVVLSGSGVSGGFGAPDALIKNMSIAGK